MLSKILKIIGIGKFEDFQPTPAVELSRLSLIYSNNGRGKTTLSSIIRAFSKGDPSVLNGRKSLNRPHIPDVEVDFEFCGNPVTFKDGQWNCSAPSIEVFDTAFVESNICSGAVVEHEHKKNLCGFILGKVGVQLAHKIASLDDLIRTQNQQIAIKEGLIKVKIKDGMPLEEFVALLSVPTVDADIVTKTTEITSLKRAKVIQGKASFAKIALPTIPTAAISTLLAKELQGVARQAEENTKRQVGEMDAHGENWVQQGLGYLKDEKCPFCTQLVTGLGIIDAYKGYFSQAYADLKEEIKMDTTALNTLMSPDDLSEKQVSVESNKGLNDFWQPLITDALPDADANALKDAWNTLHVELNTHLEQKQRSPLESMVFSPSLSRAIGVYEAQVAIFEAYNLSVDRLNGLITAAKSRIASGDLTTAEAELKTLENSKIRHLPDVDLLCGERATLITAKDRATQDKDEAKEQLDIYTETFLKQYGDVINEYLDSFGVDYRIGEPKRRFTGGKASISYRLIINGVEVEIGESTEDTPCFANTLSGGDKTTLAFAFFLSRLDQEHLDRKIVVFDDPISSLDIFRKSQTHHIILEVAKNARQVIVLSHDKYFLRLLAEGCKGPVLKDVDTHMQIRADGQKSVILPWDAIADSQAQDHKELKRLSDFLRSVGADDAEMREVARSGRPLVEANLRMRFTDELIGKRMLGEIIGAIGTSASTDELHKLTPHLPMLRELNIYFTKYHHSENPTADTEFIDETALKTYIKKAFKFISDLYQIV
jgi:wobble nucleotide-excising tRNase